MEIVLDISEKNGGVSTALNLGISKMTGEYFSWLSHDDVYYTDKIEKQIDYLISTNYIGKNIILYSDYDLINEKSKIIEKVKKDHNILTLKPEYALLRGNLNGITLLIPKKAFKEFGLFDESLRCVQDYEMWRKMFKKYTFIHMPISLAKSREHSNQVTYKNPRVITEGNKLWINIVETPSKLLMRKLEGSIENYYYEMALFLAVTPYKEAYKYCEEKYKDLTKDNIDEEKLLILYEVYRNGTNNPKEKMTIFKIIKKS
jgi:glycosyltransferase involved in cell wall biosynthesis